MRRLTILFLIAGSLAESGCMLPDYYHPGGYSSTSIDRLEESQVEWPESDSVLPSFPFRLIADSESFNSQLPSIEGIATQEMDDDPNSDPSRVANRRGRFGRH
ncbi:MAG: hypothetical protein ACYTGL_02650 [Planctomycetota bacterium]|jgi:hypothetical protein